MNFSPDLLSADAVARNTNPVFHATVNAHGLYNTQQFVLRLSPVVHKVLASLTPGIASTGEIGLQGIQAMSTYLHETIHWWQHIGSTYGFILSLNYPVQAHCTHADLKKLIDEDGFKKSVFWQATELSKRGPTGFGTTAGRANTIVNNHFDLLAFRAFTLGPEAARFITQDDLFEAIGHAFHMTYAHTLYQLSVVDKTFAAMPNPQAWADGFRSLRERKVRGHYYGSTIELWPIGAREIFEGQARFSQIQYLSHACGHRLDWGDYRNLGMLSGLYVKAFEEFLRFTESKWPTNIDDPIVGLFLLVCDLALNPASGFPAHVHPNYETFLDDVNPGARFCMFSRLIALRYPDIKGAVQMYSRSEYETITEKLCQAAKDATPLLIARVFSNWFDKSGPLASLRKEYETYAFGDENYVLRHLFAHFLAFQEDKLKKPEFFCWPGAWTAGERLTNEASTLFNKHGALFVDKENDDAIFPRIQNDRNEASVYEAFNKFYHNQVLYEVVNQWISKSGAFNYDFAWMSPSKAGELKVFARIQFNAEFGFDPENVMVLSPPA